MEIQITEKAKHAIGILLQEALKDKLTAEHGKFTGALQASIGYRLVGDEIHIVMEDYGKYIEYGTPPHFPPVEELMDWVKVKWGASSDKEARQKAFILARHISKYGTRPFPFIRTTLAQDFTRILKSVLEKGNAKIE